MSTFNPIANLIPGYCLSQVIGTGGFSTVYEATDTVSQETVAIKIGRIANQPETPQALRQLHAIYDNEWNALNRIHSENVVSPIDRGVTDDDRPFLVLEYVPGTTLSDYQQLLAIDLIPFDLRQVLILMLSAARAVGALHENDIIHNDIKLSNFRVTEAGHVKLCDLGMATSIEEALRAGSDRGQRGTPGYMSAQTVESKKKDVFALGTAYFHLLTGKRAFNPAHPLATLLTPPPPSRVRPERNIPRQIDRVVLKALSRAPADRYPDALAMNDALEKAARPIIGAKPRRPRR